VDGYPSPGDVCNLLDVRSVRCDDRVVATHRTFRNGYINCVVETAPSDEFADATCLQLLTSPGVV
jgi:hypothetical protein